MSKETACKILGCSPSRSNAQLRAFAETQARTVTRPSLKVSTAIKTLRKL